MALTSQQPSTHVTDFHFQYMPACHSGLLHVICRVTFTITTSIQRFHFRQRPPASHPICIRSHTFSPYFHMATRLDVRCANSLTFHADSRHAHVPAPRGADAAGLQPPSVYTHRALSRVTQSPPISPRLWWYCHVESWSHRRRF